MRRGARRSAAPRFQVVGLRLHTDDLAVLDALAQAHGTSRSGYASRVLRGHLDGVVARLQSTTTEGTPEP
jgi:hypothetical protein